jgi:hypothetical protein
LTPYTTRWLTQAAIHLKTAAKLMTQKTLRVAHVARATKKARKPCKSRGFRASSLNANYSKIATDRQSTSATFKRDFDAAFKADWIGLPHQRTLI